MLYNCRRIIFILSFFVGYILSFGLVRLWTVRLSVDMFTLAWGGCDNHRCHNKNPRLKMGLWCEWRQARKRWAGNFGDFWKKQFVEIPTWARPVQLWSTGCLRESRLPRRFFYSSKLTKYSTFFMLLNSLNSRLFKDIIPHQK